MLIKNIIRTVFAFVCAMLGSVLILVVSIPVKMLLVPSGDSRSIYSEGELVFLLVVSVFSYLWSGFVIEKLAKVKKYWAPMIYSFLLAFTWFSNDVDLPVWYMVAQVVMSFPFVFMGARFYLKKSSKRFCCDSLASDAKGSADI